MQRKGVAVLFGLFVGVVLSLMLEVGSVLRYPPPPGADLSKPEIKREFFQSRPQEALLMVMGAYALGCLVGAFTAAWMTNESPMRAAITVGCLLMVAGIMTVFQRPCPFWFSATTMALYLPSAWLGGRLALRLRAG